jgi:hypothetical protein
MISTRLKRLMFIAIGVMSILIFSRSNALAQGPVVITRVVPNDDSVLIEFLAVPGAVDYRVTDLNDPHAVVKYAGQTMPYPLLTPEAPLPDYSHYSIEVNGIDPVKGARLVVEAVDRLGPFQSPFEQKDMGGPCTCAPGSTDCATGQCLCCKQMVLNGQGDSNGVPIVIAKSDIIQVYRKPRGLNGGLTGSQIWFENFQNPAPFVLTGNNPNWPISAFQNSNEYIEWDNGRMTVSAWGSQPDQTVIFTGHGHFMDVLSDSKGITNASMVIHPKAHFDITGGKTLHVTWEVDAHYTGRRWCNLIVTRAGDGITNPGKLDFAPWTFPTVSGDEFRWEVHNYNHFAQLFLNGVLNEVGNRGWVDFVQTARIFWDNSTPLSDGTLLEVDKRHRFDLYLSKNSFQLEERDQFGTLRNKQARVFPDGMALPFEDCEISFVHQVYHSAEEHDEYIRGGGGPSLYYNYMTNSDQRHWDNIGVEVLDSSAIVDTMAPAVGITSPSPNAVVRGMVPLGISALDNIGVTRTEVYVDNVLFSSASTAGLTAGWDSTKVTDGYHTISAKAYDAAGNVGDSGILPITVNNSSVDNTPPAVTLSGVTAGATVSGTAMLSASATDASGVTKTEIYVDGVLAATSPNGASSLNWDTTKAAAGAHTLQAKAYDAAGNVGNSGSLSVKVDNAPPVVTLTGATAGATVKGTVTLSASATDAGGVTRTEIYVDGVLAVTNAGGAASLSWDTTKIAEGAHTLQAKGYDAAGNVGTSDLRSVTVQNLAGPTVSFSSPKNGSSVKSTFTISLKASTSAKQVKVVIDGKYTFLCTKAPFTCTVTPSTRLAKGWHTLAATAYNAAGTGGATAKVSVNLR